MNTSDLSTAIPKPVSFKVRLGNRRGLLAYEQLFAMAYKQWLDCKFRDARSMFELLATVNDRGPRAHIFLAHCQVMLDDIGECIGTLKGAVAQSRLGDASKELHEAFVFWRVGLWSEVVSILDAIVKAHPDLPTPHLFLAIAFARTGRRNQSLRCLQQAIRTDRHDGEIGIIARHELQARAQNRPTVKPTEASRNKQ